MVMADPVAAKYVRPFRMGKELVRGLDRWCLWLADVDPTDIAKSPILKQRIEANRQWRSQQKPTGDAYKLKDLPHLMRPNKERPLVDYVGIPRVVSETRKFYTVSHLNPEVIAGDKVYTAVDPDGLLFALMSSSMFITWQKAIGGRLKSDLNFSNTIVWNNFPVPDLEEKQQKAIITAGTKVLEARALHSERSLAEHYNPLAMSPELLKAHATLDKAVDQAFGATRKLTTEAQRLESLFRNYQTLVRQNN